MGVKYFQTLPIDVAVYFEHVWKVVPYVLIKNEKPNIFGTGG